MKLSAASYVLHSMKHFIILIALIIVLVVGFRIASSTFSRNEPAPVTMTGDNDASAPSTDADTPEERAQERLEDQENLTQTQQDLQEQRTIAPLEQETDRLETTQELQQQREELAVERETAPMEMEQQRLEAEQELLRQQQAVIRERQALQELQAEEQQRAMPPMPETNIEPVTDF